MARRYRVHANTVSSAWHELLGQGWLELRRGSGLYVRARQTTPLHGLLERMLAEAGHMGYAPESVLDHLSAMVHRRHYERVLVAEPDLAMREILLAELREALSVPVNVFEKAPAPEKGLVVALTTRVERLPPGTAGFTLKLRSIDSALGQPEHVPPGFLISIVSKSAEILDSGRAMLIAIGVPPDAIQQVDASLEDWQERLTLSRLMITDVVTAARLPSHCPHRVFRVVADASVEELRRMYGCDAAGK
jgi:hypothetical protein